MQVCECIFETSLSSPSYNLKYLLFSWNLGLCWCHGSEGPFVGDPNSNKPSLSAPSQVDHLEPPLLIQDNCVSFLLLL